MILCSGRDEQGRQIGEAWLWCPCALVRPALLFGWRSWDEGDGIVEQSRIVRSAIMARRAALAVTRLRPSRRFLDVDVSLSTFVHVLTPPPKSHIAAKVAYRRNGAADRPQRSRRQSLYRAAAGIVIIGRKRSRRQVTTRRWTGLTSWAGLARPRWAELARAGGLRAATVFMYGPEKLYK